MSDPVNSFIVDFLLFSWLAFFSFCLSPITIFYKLHMEHFALVLKNKIQNSLSESWNSDFIFGSGEHHFRCCCWHSLDFSVLKLQFSAKSHIEQFQNWNLEFIFGSGEHHFLSCFWHFLTFAYLKLQLSAKSHMQQFQN